MIFLLLYLNYNNTLINTMSEFNSNSLQTEVESTQLDQTSFNPFDYEPNFKYTITNSVDELPFIDRLQGINVKEGSDEGLDEGFESDSQSSVDERNTLLPAIHTKSIIKIDDEFNSKLEPKDYDFLKGFSQICFGDDFNQELNGLHEDLKVLSLGTDFNQPLDNLPPIVKLQIASSDFNHPLDQLPSTLKNLDLDTESLTYELNNLPYGLKILSVELYRDMDFSNIPPTVVNLQLSFGMSFKFNKLFKTIPPTVKILSINGLSNYVSSVNFVPNGVVSLRILDYEFNGEIVNLPESLSEIDIANKKYKYLDVLIDTYPWITVIF